MTDTLGYITAMVALVSNGRIACCVQKHPPRVTKCVCLCAGLLLIIATLVCCIRRRGAQHRDAAAFSAKNPVAQSVHSASEGGRSPYHTHRCSVELLPAQRSASDHAMTSASPSNLNSNKNPLKCLEPPASAASMSGSLLPTAAGNSPKTQEDTIMEGMTSSGDSHSLQGRNQGIQKPDTVISFNTTSNERSVELTGGGDGGGFQGGYQVGEGGANAHVAESSYTRGALSTVLSVLLLVPSRPNSTLSNTVHSD